MILLIIITLYMLYVVMKIYYVLRIELLLFVNFRKGEKRKKMYARTCKTSIAEL